ncbi:hypothetical protein KY359_04400 [Candidatus Woesearchaeota archaeon]|nr:hypothetical protein [Candidatus Woesearchaeota archaeon]
MAIKILPPRGILGMCDFVEKEITIVEREYLELADCELERLADLGERCIKIAQTLGGRSARGVIQGLDLRNFGDKEYPFYDTDVHWFFGVLGGLEIYGSQFCDGPRSAVVVYRGDEVFGYDCSGFCRSKDVTNAGIMAYVAGPWETMVDGLYLRARSILDRSVLTLEDSRF